MSDLKLDDLYIHEWLPKAAEQNERPHIIFGIHGLGAHGGWFRNIAEIFAEHGIPFYSYDLRGFGKSNYRRGDIDSYKTWINENQRVYEFIKEKYPNSDITVFGHSLGAVMACNVKLKDGDRYILSVPGFEGTSDKFGFFDFFLPTVAKLIFSPGSYVELPESEDQEIIKDDSLQTKAVTARLLGQYLLLKGEAKKNLREIQAPVLGIKVYEDHIICNKTFEKLYAQIPSKNKEFYTLSNTLHDWIWYESVKPGSEKIIDWIRSN